MSNLIPFNKMTSMQIAEVTGKYHHHVMRDIADEITKLQNAGIDTQTKFGFSEREDSTGRKIPYYELTREGVLQLAARYDAVVRAKLIEIAMRQEKQLPSNYKEALLALVASEEEKEKLQFENQSKTLQLEQQKPKVLFADSVTASSTSILVGDLAKLIRQNGFDIGEIRLWQWMRDNGYAIREKGRSYNMLTQYSLDREIMEVKEGTRINSLGESKITKTTMVTGKGQVYFVNKFLGRAANA